MSISFSKGIHRCPANTADGELDYAVNLMPVNGEMRTVSQPERLNIELSQGDVILCIHHVQTDKHLIVKNENTLAYYDSRGIRTVIHTFSQEPEAVVAMGNVLIIRFPDEKAYAIWKEGIYNCLDASLPQAHLQFMLRNHFVQTLAKGDDTGITLEQTASSATADFSETVPPTPLTISFTGEYEFFVDANLEPDTIYRLNLRRLEGKPKIGMSVWIIDENDQEIYYGYAFGQSPYVTFTTGRQHGNLRLRCVMYGSDVYAYRFSAVLLKGQGMTPELVVSNTEENFNAVMAVANKFVELHSRRDNKFMYPFFVRYALRMYDGSLVCPSAPCLMMPNKGMTPQMWTIEPGGAGKCDTYTSANIAELMFRVVDIEQLTRWKGLVSSVAIAVSPPIYSFNQGAEWTAKRQAIALEQRSVDNHDNGSEGYGLFDEGNGTFTADWQFRNYNSVDDSQKVYNIVLPKVDERHKEENLKNTAEFFIVKDLTLNELQEANGWVTLEMDEHTLDGLEGRQSLDDNAMSLSKMCGRMQMVYNSRLVEGNMVEHRFRGYMPSLMNGYCGNMRDGAEDGYPVEWIKAMVYGVENGEQHLLCVADHGVSNNAPLLWFAYPGLTATRAVVWRRRMDGEYQRAELKLMRHKLLNLSIWFDGFNEPMWTDMGKDADLNEAQREEMQTPEQEAVVVSKTKLQQSVVNNPFLSEPALVNIVGNSSILAMATTTQALSQGQFGDFPLYVFAADGIWAMSVGVDGAFSTSQPISRDVCSDPASVVMTDNAVVFATAQGLKMIRGSVITNMSVQMEGAVADVSALIDIDQSFNNMIINDTMDFNTMIGKSRMAYDYESNLLHIYPDYLDAHYLCSLGNGEFAMSTFASRPLAIVNDYPRTIIQTNEGLLRLAGRNVASRAGGILLTRPVCMGDPVALKRLKDLRVVWNQLETDSSVKVAVLASNDRRHWWRMRSLNSHSYRWFRIALFADITDMEAIMNVYIL